MLIYLNIVLYYSFLLYDVLLIQNILSFHSNIQILPFDVDLNIPYNDLNDINNEASLIDSNEGLPTKRIQYDSNNGWNGNVCRSDYEDMLSNNDNEDNIVADEEEEAKTSVEDAKFCLLI